MRLTITITDALYEDLRETAFVERKSMSAVVNAALAIYVLGKDGAQILSGLRDYKTPQQDVTTGVSSGELCEFGDLITVPGDHQCHSVAVEEVTVPDDMQFAGRKLNVCREHSGAVKV